MTEARRFTALQPEHHLQPPDKKTLKSRKEEEGSGTGPIMMNRRRISNRNHPFDFANSSRMVERKSSSVQKFTYRGLSVESTFVTTKLSRKLENGDNKINLPGIILSNTSENSIESGFVTQDLIIANGSSDYSDDFVMHSWLDVLEMCL